MANKNTTGGAPAGMPLRRVSPTHPRATRPASKPMHNPQPRSKPSGPAPNNGKPLDKSK